MLCTHATPNSRKIKCKKRERQTTRRKWRTFHFSIPIIYEGNWVVAGWLERLNGVLPPAHMLFAMTATIPIWYEPNSLSLSLSRLSFCSISPVAFHSSPVSDICVFTWYTNVFFMRFLNEIRIYYAFFAITCWKVAQIKMPRLNTVSELSL